MRQTFLEAIHECTSKLLEVREQTESCKEDMQRINLEYPVQWMLTIEKATGSKVEKAQAINLINTATFQLKKRESVLTKEFSELLKNEAKEL